MPRRTSSTLDLTGPFFRNDPGKTFRENVRLLMDRLVEEGEHDVERQLAAGEGTRRPIHALGGRVRMHVVGRTRNLSGRRWAVTGVISVNNSGFSKREGTSLMAAASEVERQTRAFRKTTSRMRRAKALNQAELLKGLR